MCSMVEKRPSVTLSFHDEKRVVSTWMPGVDEEMVGRFTGTVQALYDRANPQRIWKIQPGIGPYGPDAFMYGYPPPDPRTVPCGLCGGNGKRIIRFFDGPVLRTCCDCDGTGRQPERTSR